MAKLQGQTVLAAAGDAGSSDCYTPPSGGSMALSVDDPADQPYVTGVGGTSLTSEVSTPSTETVWNDGPGVGAGGGGNSVDFAAGTYQQIPEAQTYAVDHCSSTIGLSGSEQCREVPDVSASSDPDHGDVDLLRRCWRLFGGTSAAAPLWAALTADANQGCQRPVGFLNPLLYAAGAGGSPPFNDITEGDNSLFDAPADYPAASRLRPGLGMGESPGRRIADPVLRIERRLPVGHRAQRRLGSGHRRPLRGRRGRRVRHRRHPRSISAPSVAGGRPHPHLGHRGHPRRRIGHHPAGDRDHLGTAAGTSAAVPASRVHVRLAPGFVGGARQGVRLRVGPRSP